ncbi:MAG TPA: hypothetical protein VD906_10500 [Caulobacteraceae bacterium]|nr:hypothetical protein [Caulobacteraceae bacterium]
MRRLSVAVCCAGLALFSSSGIASAQGATAAQASAEYPEWGLLNELVGAEWKVGLVRQRFVWAEPGKVLAWQSKPVIGGWIEYVVFTKTANGLVGTIMQDGRTGALVVKPDSVDLRTPDGSGSAIALARQDGALRYSASGIIPVNFTMQHLADGAAVMDAATKAKFDKTHGAAMQSRVAGALMGLAGGSAPLPTGVSTTPSKPARTPAAPIILSKGDARKAAPVDRPAASSGAQEPKTASKGPIVLASAPPPPAPIREARTTRSASATPAPAPDSRQAKMQAQVGQRRAEVAAQQEAERQARLEAERQAEYRRQEQARQEAERAAFWGQMASGGLMILQAAAEAQMEVNAQNAELDRLRILAEQETRENQERAAAEQRARENEHARRVAEAQIAQQEQYVARQQQSQDDAAARAEREREEREAADRARLEREQRQKQEAAQAAAKAEQERRQREAEARQREAEARRAEEARKQIERQRLMSTGNASGSYAVVGLPPINPSSRGPGSGTVSVGLDHIGGCKANGAQVRYNLGVIMGEATVGGGFSWQGEQGCSLPASAEAWVKVSHGASYGWVSLDATPGSANGGYGYNSTGSPPWSQLICGFSGGRSSGCMDADSAKRLWTNGSVTEVRIGW